MLLFVNFSISLKDINMFRTTQTCETENRQKKNKKNSCGMKKSNIKILLHLHLLSSEFQACEMNLAAE